jgi:hypothetical protein
MINSVKYIFKKKYKVAKKIVAELQFCNAYKVQAATKIHFHPCSTELQYVN